jgi:hypothetical protein
MKKAFLVIFACFPFLLNAQKSNSDIFWENLSAQCGKAFIGEVLEAPADDGFRKQELVMHVRSCEENRIRIPFFVGDDRSRTWIFTKEDGRIQLKHDHRHKDGTEDEVTMYGGRSANKGLATLQTFPADQETADLIPAAASNIWWVEVIEGEHFTYNLRRIGTDRYFSIRFDFDNKTNLPEAPWGWVE